ncbi:alpha/beta fold hydrolase [Streptomyces sp. NPDC005774]|uniref:alpha/beta fold hydrolase n=1 Tax=Streptomyces sp. NPDC005774 TaxID=3364728 RepID=UPI0036B6C407
MGTTDYRTDPFFGLEDVWLPTAEGEITHLHDVGEGTPVVFLHGSGTGVSAAANWWLTLPAVQGDVRAIAPDIIGFGATVQAPDATYGIREWGAHTLRVLDALGIEKAWLVGNSLGGWIALQLAIEHPDRVLGVISMGTGGSAPTAAIKAHATPNTELAALRRSFEGFVTDPHLVTDAMVAARQVVAEYEVASGRLDHVIEARERDRAALPLDGDALARLELPVLLVHGLADHVIPPARTWELVNVIPTADAVLLQGCGHWSQIERADAFAQLVTDFIAGRWRSRDSRAANM